MARNYSSTAATTTLSAPINDTQTTMIVAATTGFPAAPFALTVDTGAVGQEAVLVTNVAGTTLTITRGYDSTSAQSHLAGATVTHSHLAIDFRDAATHQTASTGVHGITGAVVGTTDTQTVTNKTLGSTNTLNGFTASKMAVTDGTGKLVAGASTIPAGTVVGTSDAQTLTNKTIAIGSNTVSGTTAQFNTALTDNDFATLAGSETLTNKTVNLTSNTLSGTKAQFNTACSDDDFAYQTDVTSLKNPASVSVARAVAQSIPNNTVTNVTFDTEVYDTDTMFTASSANITVKTAGLWLITATGGFAAGTGGRRVLRIVVNGTDTLGTEPPPSTGGGVVLNASGQLRLAVNDVINLMMFQVSGGALNTTTSTYDRPQLQAVWLGV